MISARALIGFLPLTGGNTYIPIQTSTFTYLLRRITSDRTVENRNVVRVSCKPMAQAAADISYLYLAMGFVAAETYLR